MGRELRRVPLDFDWPLNKVWEGFVNPNYKPCPQENVSCFSGYTAAGKWLDAIARLIALIGDESADSVHAETFKARGRNYPHPFLVEWDRAPRFPTPRDVMARIQAIENDRERMLEFHRYHRAHPPQILPLTPELAELVAGLAGKPCGGFMSSLDYDIAEKLKRSAGITSEAWGVCPVCEGHADDPASRAAYEAWEKTPPPSGPGYQLWETVSEGSPVSAVYADAESFVRYLVGEGHSEASARKFIDAGWVPSGVIANGEMKMGIDALDLPSGETP